jgi:hypothetical protein
MPAVALATTGFSLTWIICMTASDQGKRGTRDRIAVSQKPDRAIYILNSHIARCSGPRGRVPLAHGTRHYSGGADRGAVRAIAAMNARRSAGPVRAA